MLNPNKAHPSQATVRKRTKGINTSIEAYLGRCKNAGLAGGFASAHF